MSYINLDAAKVSDAPRGNWDRIYTALAPEMGLAVTKWGYHVPCPVHGGSDRFRLLSKQARPSEHGEEICNSRGAFERDGTRSPLDGVDILMRMGNRSEEELPTLLQEIATVVSPDLIGGSRT